MVSFIGAGEGDLEHGNAEPTGGRRANLHAAGYRDLFRRRFAESHLDHDRTP
jgi:hypothetical protein